MNIHWDNMLKVGAPVISAVVAWVLARVSEKRVKLIGFYGHTSAFTLPPPNPLPDDWHGTIHTHAVVVRNVGKKTATRVRVSHFFLPKSFNLWPAVKYTLEEVPNSGPDIVIPTLVPGEQVTINYLYGPPVFVGDVTSGVRSDEGFAAIVTVLPTPQPPKWMVRGIWAVFGVGAVVVLYMVYEAVIALVRATT